MSIVEEKEHSSEGPGSKTCSSQSFSAFLALVVSYSSSLDDKIIEESWREFKNPTVECASRLFNAQALMDYANTATYETVLEAFRVKDRGNVLLKRLKDDASGIFLYKLQMHCIIDENGNRINKTEEQFVSTSTIVTAVRAGISLLAAALADNDEFFEKIKEKLLDENSLATFEQSLLNKSMQEAKAAANTQRL